MNIEKEIKSLKNNGYFNNFEDKESYYLVTCPFHKNGKETTPSFSINKERINIKGGGVVEEGYTHCFGCGYKARFTKFLADIQGISEFEILQQIHKAKIYEEKRDLNLFLSREEKRESFDFKPLPLTERGRNYLYKRKINDYVIQEFNIISNGYDNVVFPIVDKSGDIVGVQARDINKKFFNNTKGLDKKNNLYGLYQLKKTSYNMGERLYITESIIDTLTLWSWGYKAVALMGAEFSDYHIKELIKLPYDLVLALDNDEVGKNAMREAERVFKKFGKKITLLKWGNFIEKDINDLSIEKFKKIGGE